LNFLSHPIGLTGGLNLHQYAPNPVLWIDPWGWSCRFDTRVQRWRDSETGQFTQRPTNPAELVNNGRIDYQDIAVWAAQGAPRGLPNLWRANPIDFPTGGFKYVSGPYSIHGHGINPKVVASYPGNNSAVGPTARISEMNAKPPMSYRTNGTWGTFKSDKNGAHIPIDNSPF